MNGFALIRIGMLIGVNSTMIDKSRHNKQNNIGVTFVEVIIAMVIISLVIMGISGIFVAGKRHLKSTQFQQQALNLARAKLEELEVLDFDDDCLTAGDYPDSDKGCEDDHLPGYFTDARYGNFSRSWTIVDVITPPDTETTHKDITVTVTWEEPGP